MINISLWHVFVLLGVMLWLTLVICALIITARDETLKTPEKVIWVLIVLCVPIMGLIAWGIARMVGHLRRA